jgi:hypothetical protein
MDGSGQLQWRFQNDPVPNATTTTLLLTNVQPDDAGDYSVVAYNAAGSVASLPARLTVYQPAIIVAQPTNQLVQLGANATFAVSAAGMNSLRYQWRFNGADLPGQTNATFTVNNVQFANDGIYNVLVFDRFASLLSAPARLFVLVSPAIAEPPLSQTVVAGGDVTLSVRITGYPPPFGYIWRRGPVTLNTQVLTSSNCFFTLTNVQPSQGGPNNTYRVIVTNAAVPTLTVNATFNLNVLADTDGDHLPDAWETQFSLNPISSADAALDSDGDGISNQQEYEAGTDPTNALSYLKVERLMRGPSTIEFNAVSNRTYAVQFRDVLGAGNWTNLIGIVAQPTNRLESIIDPAARPSRFYRLVTPFRP